MPRDPRPFVTYPLNYTGHPRIESLSDAAFRVFHEMNDYSRVHGLDGSILTAVAAKRWPAKVLAELVKGVDDRPLVVRTADAYVLRSYADHQFTTADAEALRAARAEAGRRGGEAKARARQTAGNGVAIASREAKQILPESESESESDSDDFYSPTTSQSSSRRASVSTDAIPVSEMTRKLAGQRGITSLRTIVDAIHRHCDVTVTADQAFQVSLWLIEKSKDPVQSGQKYVLGCIAQSPAEVQQHIYGEVA